MKDDEGSFHWKGSSVNEIVKDNFSSIFVNN